MIGTLCHPLAARSADAPSPPPAADAAAAPAPAPASTLAPPPTSAPATPANGATPTAAPKPFPILEYQVEGNTLLSVPDVERAVTPYLGEGKSIKDIEAARAHLEQVYHDRGYKTVLVGIPVQQVMDGTVRLVVTEAKVGKLHIAGSRYHSLEGIRDKFAQLNQDSVPNFDEVQKELGSANRSADLRVTPILKASDTPGRVDVELSVQDELPLHAILEVNNRYSANTSHPRVTGELRYDNLFQSSQSASFQYQIAPVQPSDAKIWSASYVIPTSGSLVWALYAVHSASNVAAVGNLDVVGNGNIYGVRLIDSLPTTARDFYHSVTFGLDYKDFGQTVVLNGAAGSIESPVEYPLFSLQYSATWLGAQSKSEWARVAAAGSRSNTTLDLGLNFLIRGLGTNWRQFANKRAYAGTSFITLHPGISHEQVLPAQWTLVGKLDGQLASGALINNEQYAAGGAETVRGYTEAERLGDNGAHATLELRTPQQLRKLRSTPVEQSYVFLFADAAKLQTLQPLPGQEVTFTLASAGVGLRFKAAGLSVALDGARILKDGSVTPEGRYRGLFQCIYTY